VLKYDWTKGRYKQLLDDLKETKGHWELKEEAAIGKEEPLDPIMWRI
jgi:hypothetical protein